MSHAQLPSLSHHRPSASLAHCDDSVDQGGCCDSSVRRVEYPNIKNAHCLSLPKKLWATMSILALSSLFAVLCLNSSPVTGCRHGSVPTAWHTSLRRLAVMSLISLCQIEGKPPLGQLSVWSTVNCVPQMQWERGCCGLQPYLRPAQANASMECPFVEGNPMFGYW